MEATAKMPVAGSKISGPLKDHPPTTTARDKETGDEAVGVIDMHYMPKDDPNDLTGLLEVNGERVGRFSPWHFDHCYNDDVNYAGVLRRPIVVTTKSGRTGLLVRLEC